MRTRCITLLIALTLPPAGAHTTEEWQVTSTRRVHGSWGVAELRLFSDQACTRPLLVPNASTFSAHPVTEKVPVFSAVQNVGKDCVEQCDGKSGYCKWCGEGNACCRRGFKSDPPECQTAQGFTTSSQHECVAAKQEQQQTHSGGLKVFDGDVHTSYTVACDQEGCASGSLLLGGALVQETASVQCVHVLQRRDDAISGSSLQASLVRRPPLPASTFCPGACRSGRYLEGSKDGVCQDYLSPHGWCGTTKEHTEHGWNCRGCDKLEAATPRTILRVSTRESFEDGQIVVTKLRAAGFWSRGKSEEVQHVGEDCWGPCISGLCDWCGSGHACCKSGAETDNPECADATGYVALAHHECVALLRGQAGMFDGLPPWVVYVALVAPWVALFFGLLCYMCRGRQGVCCCLCRKKGSNDQPKTLSGEVFAHRPRGSHSNGDDELRKKVLREQAKKLDWLT